MCKRTFLFVYLFTAAIAAGQVIPEPEPAAIAGQLRSADATQQREALKALEATDKRHLTEDLKAALNDALLEESRRHTRRYWQSRQNTPLEPLPDPELVTALARAVTETRDPRTIPVLAESLGPGFTLVRALVEFGTASVPDVVRVTMSPESTHDAVNHGLVTLRMIVERAGGPQSLDRRTRMQIRRVASHYLNNRPQFVSTLWWAIDLGAVLDDPALRARIEKLSQDPELAVAMGAWDLDVVAKTQQRAADRLAGLLALPRP